METLEFIIFGGETKRYHTWPVLKEQRVDSHSFHVAMIVSMIALGADPNGAEGCEGLSAPLLMAALTHDLAEHRMGDLPAPVKRNLPDYMGGSFREVWGKMEEGLLVEHGLDWELMLTTRQMRWLKLADAMEGALYCIRERMLGNRFIATPFNNYRKYLFEMMKHDGSEEVTVTNIVKYIDDMWEQASGGA